MLPHLQLLLLSRTHGILCPYKSTPTETESRPLHLPVWPRKQGHTFKEHRQNLRKKCWTIQKHCTRIEKELEEEAGEKLSITPQTNTLNISKQDDDLLIYSALCMYVVWKIDTNLLFALLFMILFSENFVNHPLPCQKHNQAGLYDQNSYFSI